VQESVASWALAGACVKIPIGDDHALFRAGYVFFTRPGIEGNLPNLKSKMTLQKVACINRSAIYPYSNQYQ
jgi:hypothetical protein